jgi:excisionase family DNA binding protein
MMDDTIMTVKELAAFLSIGRTKTYDLLAPRGPLKVIRVGRAVRVPMSAVRDWMTEQLESAHDDGGDDRDGK